MAEQTEPGAVYTEARLLGIRKTIAERMAQSAHETAPVVLMRSMDITELKKSRDEKKIQFAAQGKKVPSINDVIIRAVVLALKQHPQLNATYENGIVRRFADINLNVAVAVDTGLVTPVIRNVGVLSVADISEKVGEAAQKAKEGRLTGQDWLGGTFTVTNLGMLGIEMSTPILNIPQVAILAIGMVQPYLVLEQGNVTERFKTFFSLTLDHRIVDGHPGALFLKTLAETLAQPELIWG